MSLVGVSKRRLAQLSDAELYRECRKLSDWWEKIGCPDPDMMPRIMWAKYLALQEERGRRGHQLPLF